MTDQTFDSGDRSLDLLMRLAHAAGHAVAKNEELRAPMLVVGDDDRDIGAFTLISPEVPIADMARVIIWAADATRAAICFEAWEYEQHGTPEEMEGLRRGILPARAVAPSTHPDRYDVLNVLGQVKGGPVVMKQWRIGTDPETKARTFAPHERPGGEVGPGNFNPLFADYEVVRRLIRKHAELAYWRDKARASRN